MKKIMVAAVMALSMVAAGCGKEALADVSGEQEQPTADVQLTDEEITESEENAAEETAVADKATAIGYVTWSDYHSEETDNYQILINTINSHIDIIDEGYDALKASLAKYNEEEAQEAVEFVENNIDYAREFLESMDYSMYFTNESSDTVYRADTQVFSFANCNSSYLGGAHPGTYFSGVTYDSVTGKELELKDVVTDYDKLCEITLEKLKNYEYADCFFEDYETTVRDMFYGTGEYELALPEYWLTSQGMKLLFNEYAIAPYAAGYTMIDITYEDAPELFNSQYVYNGEGTIQYGNGDAPVYIDVDGSRQEVTVDTTVNDDEYRIDFEVNVGDKKSNFEFYGFSSSWYVLTDKNGNSFMYVETVMENDYTVLEVLKLDGTGAAKVGEVSGLWFAKGFCTDPYNMIMYERTESLGSFGGARKYHISDTGMPETDDTEYTIRMGKSDWFNGLVSIVDLVVYVDGQEVNAPAGTVFYVMATDNKSYVKAVTDDGMECEIRYTLSDYTKMINGQISEWDAFEMVPYAG